MSTGLPDLRSPCKMMVRRQSWKRQRAHDCGPPLALNVELALWLLPFFKGRPTVIVREQEGSHEPSQRKSNSSDSFESHNHRLEKGKTDRYTSRTTRVGRYSCYLVSQQRQCEPLRFTISLQFDEKRPHCVPLMEVSAHKTLRRS
jgi:hypothetical protein